MALTLRVRGRLGLWRLNDVAGGSTVQQVADRIASEKAVANVRLFDGPPARSSPMDGASTLGSNGITRNGHMLFAEYDGDGVQSAAAAAAAAGGAAAARSLKVDKDGNVVLQTHEEAKGKNAFRPGLGAMRDMKKQWKWSDFMDLQSSLEYTLKRQKEPNCKRLTIDTAAALDFSGHCQSFAYQQCRIAYMYGFFTEDGEAVVTCLYEPPQVGRPDSCVVQEDERAEALERVTKLLGLERVGWLFAHPPRDEGFAFSGQEVLMAARLQAAAGMDSPFVTAKLTATKEGQPQFEAFQISQQGVAMAEQGVFHPNPDDPKTLRIDSKYHVMVEAKPAETAAVEFLLVNVAIAQEQYFFHPHFPVLARTGQQQTPSDLRRLLRSSAVQKRAGAGASAGVRAVEALRNLEALVYVASQPFLADALPELCTCVLDPDQELPDGQRLLIEGFCEQ